MEVESVLQKFLSGDGRLVWSAGWDVIKASKNDLSGFPIERIDEIRKAVDALPEGRIEESVDLALRILENKAQGGCRCALYSAAVRFLPEEEEAREFVVIERKEDIPWEPEFECKCIECGKKYFVHESHNYHYHWAEWREITEQS